jgi:hypothetical protein
MYANTPNNPTAPLSHSMHRSGLIYDTHQHSNAPRGEQDHGNGHGHNPQESVSSAAEVSKVFHTGLNDLLIMI